MIVVGKSVLRDKVLAYFLANRGAKHYVRELASMLKLDAKNLSAELARLERQGLLASETRGNQRHYSLARSTYARQLTRMLEHSLGIPQVAGQALSKVQGVNRAWIYGSFAKGKPDAHSDLDLLVVGNPAATELAEAAGKLERNLLREVNYTVLSPAELTRKLKNQDPFITDVWSGERIEVLPRTK
jgi:predicted nucleotidyltransferase